MTRLLKVAEVAERLGLGQTTVWEKIASGEIPSVKFGDARSSPRRVSDRALDEYIANLEAATRASA